MVFKISPTPPSPSIAYQSSPPTRKCTSYKIPHLTGLSVPFLVFEGKLEYELIRRASLPVDEPLSPPSGGSSVFFYRSASEAAGADGGGSTCVETSSALSDTFELKPGRAIKVKSEDILGDR